MGNAAAISLQEFRQARVQADARRHLHERFDRWLDAVEERVQEKIPTLDEMAQAVFAMRQELTGMITEALVGQAHAEALEQQTMLCPHCGRLLRVRVSANRTVETVVGAVSLSRPYFYCVRCQKGFYPMDEVLRDSQWAVW